MPSLGPLKLDEVQFKAASKDGNVLVVAGPGAGKTRTLLGRVLFLLENGVLPENIFLLTFTVKAASELRERLERLGIQGVQVDTFHGLAYEICRLKGLNPRLIDSQEQERIFREVLKEKGLPQRGVRKKLEKLLTDSMEEDLFLSYQRILSRENLWDFHRLIKEAVSVNPLKDVPCHLLIDEFQDLNPELISFLRSFGQARFYLVGDPAQAIYGFRGARPEVVKNFLTTLEGLETLFLPKSYRVPEKILNFALGLREAPFELPPLKAERSGGELLAFSYQNPQQEARAVARQVEELLGGLQMETSHRGLSPGEIAVVARVRKILGPLREAFEALGIPVEESTSFKENHLSQLEEIFSQAESLKGLKRRLRESDILFPELSFILAKSQDLKEFQIRWQLLRLQATVFLRKKGVALLTIHETKGLEFKAVFLIGAEEGLLPFQLLEGCDFSEEKRLAYVAVTRAEAIFRASFVKRRVLFGKRLPGRISPFFQSLPQTQTTWLKPRRPRQKGLF